MFRTMLRGIAAGSAALWLSACVPDQSMIDAGLAKAPEAKIDPTAYVARQDGSFALPAIPLERLPAEYQRQTVYYPTAEVPGTVIIDPAQRHLYFVTGRNTRRAMASPSARRGSSGRGWRRSPTGSPGRNGRRRPR